MSRKTKAWDPEIWKETQEKEEKRDNNDFRDQYSREYARLIHSSAFRRLQGKTQVLGLGESDFYRTRLTHSLEVMQIGSGIVDALRSGSNKSLASKDNAAQYLPPIKLIETICLAHDLGHPPFGHGGEIALNYCMLKYGGFEGNGQTLRILSKLEKYHEKHGINPSRRLLLGILKYPVSYKKVCNREAYPKKITSIPFHNLKSDKIKPPKCYLDSECDLVEWILCELSDSDRKEFCKYQSTNKHGKAIHKSLDATIMDMADDIAYASHDLEDGIALELITRSDWEESIKKVPLCFKEMHEELGKKFFDGNSRMRKEAFGSIVHFFISGVIIECKDKFKEPLLKYQVTLPKEHKEYLDVLHRMTVEKLINNANVKLLEMKGRNITVDLFNAFASDPEKYLLPGEAKKYREGQKIAEKKRVICDYIAGMTDDYAVKMYGKLFIPGYGSIFDKI